MTLGHRTTALLTLTACAGLVAALPTAAQAHPAPAAAHRVTHAKHMTSTYKQVNLVSDQVGKATLQDSNLVNAWGLALGPGTPLWVANNHTGTATVYGGGGVGSPINNVGLVVAIPGDDPTGQVYNGTNGFKLKNGVPAKFIFDSESGHVTAWNSALSPSSKAVTVSSTTNANYKGLALLKTKGSEFLLLTDFRHNKVQILNSRFAKVSFGSTAFRDTKLPKGYAPFNVAVIGSKVVVTYAKQEPSKDDDVPGAHHGYVDVYSAGGTLTKRLIRGGALNSPWGLALAPKGFGTFAGSLLVGNFGDGLVHAYSFTTGHLQGTLHKTNGSALRIPGLWALLPGNGTAGAKSDLWFSAGPNGENHGLLGIIRAA
jgi:uncharacterized protein (TIGR03118 family)